MDVTALIEPPTAASALALEVAEHYLSPSLLNHSIRSYAWAVDYGQRRQIQFDAELLYVSALLHDIGLTPEFDSHTVVFEEAGGHVAWVFAAAADWSGERRSRVSDVIVRHMWDHVDPGFDPEGHLLAVATVLDISGSNAPEWDADFRSAVVDAIPRLDLGTEFVRCFEDQALRKPQSSAAAAVRRGIAQRMATNPLDERPRP